MLSGPGYQVGMSNLALNLARDGLGVALGQRPMAGDDLKHGRLTPLSEVPVALGHPYCLVHPRNKDQRAAISKLIAWLIESPESLGLPDVRNLP